MTPNLSHVLKKHEVKFCIEKKRNCRDAFGFRSEVLATSILTRASVCCKIAFFIMHWYRIKVLPCFSSKSLKLLQKRSFKWRTFESFTSNNSMNMKINVENYEYHVFGFLRLRIVALSFMSKHFTRYCARANKGHGFY